MKASEAEASAKAAKTAPEVPEVPGVDTKERMRQLDLKKVPELKKMLTAFPCLDDEEKKAIRNMKKMDLMKKIISLEVTSANTAKVNHMFAAQAAAES